MEAQESEIREKMRRESTKDVEEHFLFKKESVAQNFGHNVGIGKHVREHGAGSVTGWNRMTNIRLNGHNRRMV